jgi:hypothetical protein
MVPFSAINITLLSGCCLHRLDFILSFWRNQTFTMKFTIWSVNALGSWKVNQLKYLLHQYK